MQVGKIILFQDFKECFRVYETIIFNLNFPHNSTDKKWMFPFEYKLGYGILYGSELDKILDIEDYNIIDYV